jgi:hypothetical protein
LALRHPAQAILPDLLGCAVSHAREYTRSDAMRALKQSGRASWWSKTTRSRGTVGRSQGF